MAKTETVQGVVHSFVYGYDLAGRLTTVDKDGVRISTYGYDPNGNRLSRNSTVGTYDDQDRMLSYGAATYSCDAPPFMRTWHAPNRLAPSPRFPTQVAS